MAQRYVYLFCALLACFAAVSGTVHAQASNDEYKRSIEGAVLEFDAGNSVISTACRSAATAWSSGASSATATARGKAIVTMVGLAPQTSSRDCPPVCGNGMTEPGETCDGNCGGCAPRANPCEMVRLVQGVDKCHPSCEVSMKGPSGEVADRCCPSGISEYQDVDCPPHCHNGVIETDEECDNTSSSCQECMLIGVAPPAAH